LVGGITDIPTYTAISGCTPTTAPTPTPTFVINLSNNSISIRDEDNKNSGADLRQLMFSKLQALCPDTSTECDTTNPVEIDWIPTVVGNDEQELTLVFTMEDSSYVSAIERDRMLGAAVATWQQAVAKSCKTVTYNSGDESTLDGSCQPAPVKRDSISDGTLTKR